MQNYIFSILTLIVCVGIILYFRKRDKRLVQFEQLKNYIQTSIAGMNRIFEDKEKELRDKTINLDVSLKKLDKATEVVNKKMASIQEFADSIENSRKNLSSSIKEAQLFDEDLTSVKERIGDLGDKIEEITAMSAAVQNVRKEIGGLQHEIEQVRIWAQDNVGDFVKGIEADLGKFRTEFSDAHFKRIEELEAGFSTRIDDAEYQLAKIEENFKDMTSRVENFGSDNFDKIDTLQSEIDGKIQSIGTDVDTRVKTEIKRFDDKIAENVRSFNDKMTETAKTINELNGKLTRFVKENSEKFKGEISTLKSDYLSQSNRILTDLDQREKNLSQVARELQSQMSDIEGQVKAAAKRSVEDALAAITKKESDVYKNIDQSSGVINDRLNQIERAINSFEKDLHGKMATMGSDLARNLDDYKRNVDDLKSLALKVEGDIEGSLSKKMREIDSYIEKLKTDFVEDYKQLIDNTKDDIIGLRDEIASLKQKTDGQKQEILGGVKQDVENLRSWSVKEIASQKDEMDTLKMRAEGILVDIRDELEQKTKQFEREIDAKVDDVMKDGDQTLNAKRAELREVANGLTTEFANRERDLIKRLDGLDDRVRQNTEIIDEKFREAFDKLQKDLANRHEEVKANMTRSMEAVKDGALRDAQALDKRMADMRAYIDEQLKAGETMKKELAVIETRIGDFSSSSESDMNEMKKSYQDFGAKLTSFEKNIDTVRAALNTAVEEQNAILKSQMEAEKLQLTNSLKDVRDESQEYLANLKKEIASELGKQSEKVLIDKFDEKADEMSKFYEKQKETFGIEIDRFKESFLPPADELLEQFARKTGEIQKGFDDKVRQVSDYINQSETEFREIKGHFEKLSVTLESLEKTSLDRMKETARGLETTFTGKVDKISRDLDNYIKQSETEFQSSLDVLKRDAKTLTEELKRIRENTREEAVDELKQLTRKTRDIETRYDQLVKKGSQLERAETIALKSDRTMEQLQKNFKELEDRRIEIEEILKQLSAVRDEKKDVLVIMNEINENKNDIKNLRANILEALEKARDAERVVDAVAKQQDKVESVKDTMLRALEMFDEVDKKMDELERRKEIVNGILSSVDDSTANLEDLRKKTSEVDDKLAQIAKISKRLEEEIRAARSNIDNIFEKQDKMSEAVERIVDIDNLFYHIDEEYKKVERMQDWVGKAQNQLERLKDSQTKLGATEPKSSSVKGSKEPDEEVIKSILRLRQQGWSIEEISKNLRMSPTYVELIIDRYELE